LFEASLDDVLLQNYIRLPYFKLMECKVKKKDVSNFKIMEESKQDLTALKPQISTITSNLKKSAIESEL